jgi:hypothetical protein
MKKQLLAAALGLSLAGTALADDARPAPKAATVNPAAAQNANTGQIKQSGAALNKAEGANDLHKAEGANDHPQAANAAAAANVQH